MSAKPMETMPRIVGLLCGVGTVWATLGVPAFIGGLVISGINPLGIVYGFLAGMMGFVIPRLVLVGMGENIRQLYKARL